MKVIPKSRQIPAGTKYVVVRKALFFTQEKLVGGYPQFDGVILEANDFLELKGYYWSNFMNGSQYLAFRVVSGRRVGAEIGVFTREEYEWLNQVNQKNDG